MAVRSVEQELKVAMLKRLVTTYNPDSKGITKVVLVDNNADDYGTAQAISWTDPTATEGLLQSSSVVLNVTATVGSPVSIVGYRLKFYNGSTEVNGAYESFSQGTYYFTGDGTITLSSINIKITE